jgi:hypothetical protein
MTAAGGATPKRHVVALSVSYERDNLLARGLGLDHLQDLLTRIARPLVRSGVDLAFGGSWRETDDNFTYLLLRLINGELGERDLQAGADRATGKLYNHSAWPYYLDITPEIEAQWIRVCRIIKVRQDDKTIVDPDVLRDDRAHQNSARKDLSVARTMSAMRKLMMTGMSVPVPGFEGIEERIPPVDARVLLGGKRNDYSGFMPGIFEEALLTLQAGKPLYILGGFGGASEVLAEAMLRAADDSLDKALTLKAESSNNRKLAAMLSIARPAVRAQVEQQYDALMKHVRDARGDGLAGVLKTRLDPQETRQLMQTRSISVAVSLARKGLKAALDLTDWSA